MQNCMRTTHNGFLSLTKRLKIFGDFVQETITLRKN